MEPYLLLPDHSIAPEPDLIVWARTRGSASNRVDVTIIGDVKVSTVFLGLDHRFTNSGPPIVFETMVFGGALDGEEARYCTWDEAVKGHREMVEKVVKELS